MLLNCLIEVFWCDMVKSYSSSECLESGHDKLYYMFQLQYNARETVGPCINITFQESKTPISLPVEKVRLHGRTCK